jgi:PAS domain S-box-containing protein
MSKHFEKRKQAAVAVNRFYSGSTSGDASDSKAYQELALKYELLLKRFNELEKIYYFHKAVLQNLTSGILIINLKGKIIFANRSALDLLKYEYLQIQGMSIARLFADQKEGEYFITRLLEEKALFKSRETYFLTGENDVVPIGLTTSPFNNIENHNTEGYIVHFSNIATQLEQRKQLERMERLATLGELAAGIAHEIKNPLAGMKAATQVLQESFKPDDFRSQLVVRVLKEIDRSNELLSRFFDFTRPRKPVQDFHDIEMLIDGIYLLLAPRFKKKKIRFFKEFANELPRVFVDAGQMEQVIMNLFLNAVDAMPQGGELKVTTCMVPQVVLQDGHAPQKAVCVKISDTGMGIRPENIEKIFNPFFTTKSSGVGLGLSITNRLVVENGGKIEVESSPGNGATFSIYFPVHQEEEPANHEAKSW